MSKERKEVMAEGEIDPLVLEAHEAREEAKALRDSIKSFQDTRRIVVKSTWQGVLIIVFAVILSVSLLGYLDKPYTCNVENLVDHAGKLQNKVCQLVFPQTEGQKKLLVQSRNQAASFAKAQEETQKLHQERVNEFKQLQEDIKQLREIIVK